VPPLLENPPLLRSEKRKNDSVSPKRPLKIFGGFYTPSLGPINGKPHRFNPTPGGLQKIGGTPQRAISKNRPTTWFNPKRPQKFKPPFNPHMPDLPPISGNPPGAIRPGTGTTGPYISRNPVRRSPKKK